MEEIGRAIILRGLSFMVKLCKCLNNTYKRRSSNLEASSEHASPVVRLGHQNLRMSVHTGNQSQTNRPPDSLCHLTLVARAQASVLVVLDLAHFRHVFGHDAEVLRGCCQRLSIFTPLGYGNFKPYLVVIHRLNVQLIQHIPPRARLLL
jgi:hypothetical protein